MIGLLAALILHPPITPADVFAPEFERRIMQQIRPCAKPVAVVDQKWVDFIRRLPSESPGKQAYVGFLKDRYEYTIGRVNEAYGIDFSSFTDLTSFDFAPLDRTRPAVQADDNAFAAIIRDVLDRAIRGKTVGCTIP